MDRTLPRSSLHAPETEAFLDRPRFPVQSERQSWTEMRRARSCGAPLAGRLRNAASLQSGFTSTSQSASCWSARAWVVTCLGTFKMADEPARRQHASGSRRR